MLKQPNARVLSCCGHLCLSLPLLYPLHLPLLSRKAILEPAKFSNVDLFLIPLPVITSCRSYLMYLRQPDVTDGGTEIASTSTKIKWFNYFAWVKPLRSLSFLALEFATSSDQNCWPFPIFLLQLFGAVDIPVSGIEGSDSPLPFPQDWWSLDCLTFLSRTYFWVHNILKMWHWESKG